MKKRVVFMGTPDIGIPSLKALVEDDRFDVVGVFTQPDKPVGRKQVITSPPIKVEAEKHGIPVFQPSKFDEEADKHLVGLNPDIVVVIAYGKLLKERTLKISEKGFVNVHFSLLPKYRGAAPVNAAIINGDQKTGNTIMLMAKGMDTGDILAVEEVSIDPNETAEELLDRLAKDSPNLLIETLVDYLEGKIEPWKQDDAEATYFLQTDLAKDKAVIDWTEPSQTIHNLIRGLNSWPIAWTKLGDKRVKIYRTRIALECKVTADAPGKLFEQEGKLYVVCGNGVLEILEIQIEGKQKVAGSEFVKGLQGETVLG